LTTLITAVQSINHLLLLPTQGSQYLIKQQFCMAYPIQYLKTVNKSFHKFYICYIQ